MKTEIQTGKGEVRTRLGRAGGRILLPYLATTLLEPPTDSKPDVEKFSMVLNLSAVQLLLVKILQNCPLFVSGPLLACHTNQILTLPFCRFKKAHPHQHCQHYAGNFSLGAKLSKGWSTNRETEMRSQNLRLRY